MSAVVDRNFFWRAVVVTAANGGGKIIVYRQRGWVGALARLEVSVDGDVVGAIRGRAKLTLMTRAGSHTIAVRQGNCTVATDIDVTTTQSAILAIGYVGVEDGRQGQRRNKLLIRRVADFNERGPRISEIRGEIRPVGYRKYRRWEVSVMASCVVIIAALGPLSRVFPTAAWVGMELAATITIVALAVRAFLYRDNSTTDASR